MSWKDDALSAFNDQEEHVRRHAEVRNRECAERLREDLISQFGFGSATCQLDPPDVIVDGVRFQKRSSRIAIACGPCDKCGLPLYSYALSSMVSLGGALQKANDYVEYHYCKPKQEAPPQTLDDRLLDSLRRFIAHEIEETINV